MPRQSKSTADYPEIFFQIWQLALNGTLDMPVETRGMATNFRQRLYRFRKLWLQEQPDIAHPYLQVDLQVEELPPGGKDGPARIVAYTPKWKAAVRQQIEAAGLGLPERSSEGKVEEDKTPPSDELASVLNSLGFTSGKKQ